MITTSFVKPDAFEAMLRTQLQIEFNEEADRIADEAAATYRKAVRAKMGTAIISLIDQILTVERHGRDLRITVRYVEG